MRRIRRVLGGAAAVAVGVLVAGCSPALDTSFGGDGLVTMVELFGEGAPGGPGTVLEQPDGKIVMLLGGGSLNLVRLHPDGSADTTFGTAGRVATDLNGFGTCSDVVRQPDGKLVVSTRLYPGSTSGLVRFNPDGSLDESFGTAGQSAGIGEDICDVELQPDGRILAVIKRGLGVGAARWLPDGSLDTGFGTGGLAVNHVVTTGGLRQWTTAVAVQPDGRIVVAGGGARSDDVAPHHVVAARFLPDGRPDPSFGDIDPQVPGQGGFVDDLGGTAVDMKIGPDGRIFVTGTVEARYSASGQHTFFVAAYDTAGVRDETFGLGGVAHAVDDGNAKALTILPDGKIVLAGCEQADIYGSDPHDGYILIRYLPDGSLDEDFGQHGISTLDRVPGSNERALEVTAQDDGRLLVAGEVPRPDGTGVDVGLYRFHAG